MAVYHGKSAKVTKNAVAVAGMLEWTIESSLEIVDVTDFGDTYKASEVGFVTWSGTFTGSADPENTEQSALRTAMLAGTKLTDVRFYIDGTHYFSGDIYMTGMGHSTTVMDVLKVTWSFTGDGALSYT